MSKTILADVSGFTPVIDDMAKQYGLIRAAVFGRMWRFCQMEDRVCNASLERIAEDLGIDRATVLRHASALVEDGYLKDITPDLRNVPHTYADTGKAFIRISIVAQSNATVAERNTSVAQSNTTVAQSYLKKDPKKGSKTDSKIVDAAKPREPRPQDFHFEALADITNLTPPGRDWKLLTKTAAGQLNRYAKELRDVGATPDQIHGFLAWFRKTDWRGKGGQFPAPADVVKAWMAYQKSLNGEINGSHHAHVSRIASGDSADGDKLQDLANRINARNAKENAGAAGVV